MKRTMLMATAMGVASVFAVGAAEAQSGGSIRIGDTKTATITENTRARFGETRGVLYTLRGAAGTEVRLTATSTDGLDPMITAGARMRDCFDGQGGLRYSEESEAMVCAMDDDSGGGESGLDSLLRTSIPAGGRLEIFVSAVGESNGSFTLGLTPPLPRAGFQVRDLPASRSATGSLGETSAKDSEGRQYDLWRITGRPGEQVRIFLISDEQDSFLELGTLSGETFTMTESDDDSGPGLGSRINTTIPDSGSVVVRATQLADTNADYKIEVRGPISPDALKPVAVAVGANARGTLSGSDAEDEEGMPVDYFRINGRPGQRVTVTLNATDFDPMLALGTFNDGAYVMDQSNDDTDGLNSRLVVTVDEDGVGVVRVSAVNQQTGAYELRTSADRP
jgi:hypothetical protein